MILYFLLVVPCILFSLAFSYRARLLELIAHNIILFSHKYTLSSRPKRIILLRHGETTANIDATVYSTTPDNKITLTEAGHHQARQLGKTLHSIIKSESVLFYISTFTRCSQTFENVFRAFQFNKKKVIFDPRIREQEWGNYQRFSQHPEDLEKTMKEREAVGKVYYRFDHGESGCDVLVRVSSFMESMFRYMDHCDREKYENIVIVTHGLTMRYFIMRYLKLSVEDFERMWNPKNCEYWILQNDGKGQFKLASEIKGLREERDVPMSATFQ